MKKIMLFLLISVGSVWGFAIQAKKLEVKDLMVQKKGESVNIAFRIPSRSVYLPSKNDKLIITPVLYNGEDEQRLEPIVFETWRTRILEQRNGIPLMKNAYKAPNKEDIYYSIEIPYKPWMNLSSIRLEQLLYGCCTEYLLTESLDQTFELVAAVTVEEPPLPEEKIEEPPLYYYEHGSANVEFQQGRFVLLENYRNNLAELEKIKNSIEKVRSEKGAVITGIWLRGTCSPEASWEYNTILAAERVKAVKKHIHARHGVDLFLIEESSIPEDWDRFKQLVEASEFVGKEQVLRIIDSDKTPDMKDMQLSKMPVYGYLMQHIYPRLRRVDYRIQYIIEK